MEIPGTPSRKQPHWPGDLLQVDELAGIWRPQPFRQFVLTNGLPLRVSSRERCRIRP